MPTRAFVVDDILRARAPLGRTLRDRHGVFSVLWLLVACGLFYGLVMGCYDGGSEVRPASGRLLRRESPFVTGCNVWLELAQLLRGQHPRRASCGFLPSSSSPADGASWPK